MNEKDLMSNKIFGLYQQIELKEFGFLPRLNKCQRGLYLNSEDFINEFVTTLEKYIKSFEEKEISWEIHNLCYTIAEKMSELNEYVRKENYQLYLNMNEEELKEEQNKDIAKYEVLINNILKAKTTNDPSENTFNEMYNNALSSKYINADEDIDYDTLYYVVKSILDHNYSINKDLYSDMLKASKAKVIELFNMKNEEYRNYKISLLKLSEEEIKNYNKSSSKK